MPEAGPQLPAQLKPGKEKPMQPSEGAQTKAQQPAIVPLTNQRETTCRNTPFSVFSQQNLPNDD